MDRRTSPLLQIILIGVAFAVLSGCAGWKDYMREVPPDKANYAPTPETGVIVFMRPSGYESHVQSNVFDVTSDSAQLVGIVAAKKRLAHIVKPGSYRFMVVGVAAGGAADFMDAEIQAGETYYAFVTPRDVFLFVRFSLRPIHMEDLGKNTDWMKCNANCAWVELSPKAEQWAMDNMQDIETTRKEYFAKWMEKPEDQRPKLKAEDGR